MIYIALLNTSISPDYSGVKVFWKRTVSGNILVNRSKLCKNCVFPKNFHIRKLVQISVFYAMRDSKYYDVGKSSLFCNIFSKTTVK